MTACQSSSSSPLRAWAGPKLAPGQPWEGKLQCQNQAQSGLYRDAARDPAAQILCCPVSNSTNACKCPLRGIGQRGRLLSPHSKPRPHPPGEVSRCPRSRTSLLPPTLSSGPAGSLPWETMSSGGPEPRGRAGNGAGGREGGVHRKEQQHTGLRSSRPGHIISAPCPLRALWAAPPVLSFSSKNSPRLKCLFKTTV